MLEILLRSYQSDPYLFAGPVEPLPERVLPFPRWKLNDAKKVLGADIPPEHRYAWGMYNGDHWQGGWGWAGPMVTSEDENYQTLWAEIIRMFCSRNVIREILKTHVNAVLGRPVRWALVPIRGAGDERDETSGALKTLIAEASVFVRQWMESRQAHMLMRKFLLDLLMPPGRGMLRLFQPKGGGQPITEGSRVLTKTGGKDYAQTLGGIYIDKPNVEAARMFTDPETQRQASVALFKARTATGHWQDAASLSFLDPSGERTIIAALYEDGGSAAVGYQMGGRLIAHEGTRDPLITAQLLQQQRIMNYAESIIPRTLTTAGFLDRILLSTQLNGDWETDEEGNETYAIDPDAIPTFGPGQVTALQPIVLQDDDGKYTISNPSIERGEPVVPTGAIQSSEHLYFNMRREADQGHLIPGEDSESNVIRFGLSLLESAIPVARVGRFLIETALALAEALRNEPGRYTDQLRAQVSCFLNVGPVSPEQRTSLISAFEKSLLSRESVQESMGVEDVDSENDRIAAQPGAAIDLAIRMANSYKMLIEAGMPPRLAAKHSGYSEEEATEIEREQKKREEEQQKVAQDNLKLEASLAPKNQPSQGSAGLRSKRQGRPSGTTERNPGQQQNKGARALQSKKNNRRPV